MEIRVGKLSVEKQWIIVKLKTSQSYKIVSASFKKKKNKKKQK